MAERGTVVIYVDVVTGVNGLYADVVRRGVQELGCDAEVVVSASDVGVPPSPSHPRTALGGPFAHASLPGYALLGRVLRFVRYWWKVPSGTALVVSMATHLEAALLVAAIRPRKPAWTCVVVHDPIPHRWFTRRLRKLESAATRWMWRQCDRLVVHSEAGESVLLQRGIDAGSVRVTRLPLLVDVPHRSPEQRAGVCLVGTLRPDKDYAAVVNAYQRLPRAIREEHHLTIAGRAQSDFDLAALQAQIDLDPFGIQRRIEFLSRAELDDLLLRSKVSVVPYVDPHSASAVAQEVLAFGCWLLAPPAGALLEHSVSPGFRPWLNDIDGQAEALYELLTGPDLASPTVPDQQLVGDLARACLPASSVPEIEEE